MPSPFADLLAALARAFEAIGARWYLFGAQAALLHGAARFTADVDVTVHLRDEDPKALVNALAAAGFQMRVEGEGFIEQTRVLPALHTATGIPVDIVLAGPGIEELFLERSEVHVLEGVRVPVARAEDLLVMKVLAGRPKDIEDVIAILGAQLNLPRLSLELGTTVFEGGPEDLPPPYTNVTGPLPPFGTEIGTLTLVDEAVMLASSIAFDAFASTDIMDIVYDDFSRLERPRIASFAIGGELPESTGGRD